VTPYPGRSIPHPRVCSLIVVSLRSATGRCGLIRPPYPKLQPLSYPPPAKKLDQNPLQKTKPPRHPQAVSAQTLSLRLIVMFSAVVTGRIIQFRQPSRKMKAIPPPLPPTNIADFPSLTTSHCAFPRPSEPTPRRTLVDCHVFEARDQEDRSNLSTWLQFNEALKPPRRP
jgi:hypothetical protein